MQEGCGAWVLVVVACAAVLPVGAFQHNQGHPGNDDLLRRCRRVDMDLTSSPSVVGFCRARFLWQKYVRATQEIRGYAAESDECSNCRGHCRQSKVR